jgi:hypothetical protein
MPRWIVTHQDVEEFAKDLVLSSEPTKNISGDADLTARFEYTPTAPERLEADDYSSRLVKYIPSEVITLYVALGSILANTSPKPGPAVSWIIFSFCLLATPLYLRQVAKVVDNSHLLISTVAFAVWAAALGRLPSIPSIYGALLLPMYTFLVAIWEA